MDKLKVLPMSRHTCYPCNESKHNARPIEEDTTTSSDHVAQTQSEDSQHDGAPPPDSDYGELIDAVVEIIDEKPELVPLLWQRLTEKNSDAVDHWREAVKQQLLTEGFGRAETPVPLTPMEMALLHVFYLRCRHANLPGEELKSIFADAINPTALSPRIGRLERFQAIVNTMFPGGTSGGGKPSNGTNSQSTVPPSPGIAPLEKDAPAA